MMNSIVTLKKSDGTVIKVPMEKFSDEDQQFINNKKKGR